MKAVIQRVRRAAVRVEDRIVSESGRGLLVFLGVEKADGVANVEALVRRIAGLRVFDDAEGKMNLSCEQIGGEYLVVSQFTIAADLAKGKRPNFGSAMRIPESERLYEAFCGQLGRATGRPVHQGRFGASMLVEIENEGPATFLLDA